MKRVGLDCLKQNAEIVLDLFQNMIIKHVLSMQIHDKTLSRIIRGNPDIDNQSDDPPDIEPIAGKITKSSLLGQDPWGDKELPPKTPQKGEEDAEASSAYSAKQGVLKSIQDNAWAYSSTHLRRILHEDILLHVVDKEMEYEADTNGVRSKSARKRMPWKVYRETVGMSSCMAMGRSRGSLSDLYGRSSEKHRLYFLPSNSRQYVVSNSRLATKAGPLYCSRCLGFRPILRASCSVGGR